MVGAISNVNSYYNLYGYQPLARNQSAQNAAPNSIQTGKQTALWAAQRPASPETPVQPVDPVPAVKADASQPVRLGPVIREGADPAEMAVRMRITPYQDDSPLPAQKTQDGNDSDLKVGAKGAQEAVEEGKCQTCEKRKYQDGSDDMGVSFQTPTRIAPEQVASAVRGHEQEHVVRERAKAQQEDRHVVSQSVTLHTDICPECGKVYISGGTTRTVTAADQEQETMQNSQQKQENAGFSVFG